MQKKLLYLAFALALALTLLGLAGLGAAYLWLVVLNPGEEIRRENIEKILAVESPVYYRDGVNRIGVFFEQAHRHYIPYQRIPTHFVQAIVAAEDSSFFQHPGIDFGGMLRATVANIKARRVVQGGSTITQQAAKNLFKRKDRSLSSKLQELLYALRLEYHYEKEDILEFYINQFYVSGNGRGLGMAARYFFDKGVDELELLESAFIAGSVKGPNHYNPFVKRSEEDAGQARRLARQRSGYVLAQMARLGFIDQARMQHEQGREIPFRQGRMTYALNTVLDLVREGLAEPEVVEALSRHGIDNVATSGIKIISSVDKNLQVAAHFALRKELSRLDIQLRGYDHRAIQTLYVALPKAGAAALNPGSFLLGRIVAIGGTPREPLVEVALTASRSDSADPSFEPPVARLDRQGLFNLLTPLARYRQHAWSEADNADLTAMLAELAVDDLVYVSVRERQPDGGLVLDLEKYPELQGGVLALREGAIRAMVGGMDNRHYNRAISARRPVGSVMKPLVYAAALQLGWNSADPVDNRRQLFFYQNRAYVPRPLGEIKHEEVSLSWAGVTSENLASVWLLYHLCDHLPPVRFAELATQLGLARKEYESMTAYTRRIRDQHGVVVDRETLYRTAFERAVSLVEADLLFAGRAGEYDLLRTFHYGSGFERFREEVAAEFFTPTASAAERREGELRREILARSYLDQLALRDRLREQEADDLEAAFAVAPLHRALEGELLLSAATLDLLEEVVEEEYSRLAALSPYDPEVLHQVRDFRVLVALNYLVGLGRALGVESPLEPVLSFPLGSNAITLLEVTRIFEAMRSGHLHLNAARIDGGGLGIIERIESREGELIYAPRAQSRPLFAPRISLAISDILFNAMEHGTGRSAHNRVRLRSPDPERDELLAQLDLRVPLLGKTGTANRFVNASFAGYLPGPGDGEAFSLESGYTMAAYVGFDDNQPMVRGTTRITGGGGALPVWARLAEAVYRQGGYSASLDLDDFAFGGGDRVGLLLPELGQMEIPVETALGGVVSRALADPGRGVASSARIVTFGRYDRDGSFEPQRFFQPYWREGESN